MWFSIRLCLYCWDLTSQWKIKSDILFLIIEIKLYISYITTILFLWEVQHAGPPLFTVCCLKQQKAHRFAKSSLIVNGRSTRARTLTTWHSTPSSTNRTWCSFKKQSKTNQKAQKAFLLCTSQALSTHHCSIVLPILHQSSHNCVVMPGSFLNSNRSKRREFHIPTTFHCVELQTPYFKVSFKGLANRMSSHISGNSMAFSDLF